MPRKQPWDALDGEVFAHVGKDDVTILRIKLPQDPLFPRFYLTLARLRLRFYLYSLRQSLAGLMMKITSGPSPVSKYRLRGGTAYYAPPPFALLRPIRPVRWRPLRAGLI
jgi:hypothetical protein